jgi:hypothetical protein
VAANEKTPGGPNSYFFNQGEFSVSKFGVYLIIGGIGSIILNQFGYEFRLLSWIDAWGPGVGWAIRGGLIALGAILVLLGGRSQNAVPVEEAEPDGGGS